MEQVRDVAKRARRLVFQGTLLVGGVSALLLWVAGSASADELSTPPDATASVSSVTDPIEEATGTATQATEAAVEEAPDTAGSEQVLQAASDSGSGAAAATETGTAAVTTAAAEASGAAGSATKATTSEATGAVSKAAGAASEAAGSATETVDTATETATETAGNAVDAGGATADTVVEAASGAAVDRTSHVVPDTDAVFETISAAKATVGSSAASGGSLERVAGTSLQLATSAGGSGPPDAAEGRPPTGALPRPDALNAGPGLVPAPAATTSGSLGVSDESAPLGGSPWGDVPFSRRLPLGVPASGSLLDGGRVLQLFTFATFLSLLILAAPGMGRWLRLVPVLGPRQVVISLRERPG